MDASTRRMASRSSVGRPAPAAATASKRRRNVRWSQLVVASIAVTVPAWLFAGARSGARAAVTEFSFTSAPQDYVVPAAVCQVRIEVIGAAGGEGGTAGAPGPGARATAPFAVTPGETLHVHVGGRGGEGVGLIPGAGGWNGGGAGGRAFNGRQARAGKAGSGGGGATDVRRGGDGLEHRIIVGGGGSGGGGGGIGGQLGTGGGGGGGLTGYDGFAALGSANPATGGKGGTQKAGGAPGRNAPYLSVTARAGTRGVGGSGASGGISGGGGGGGGLYGGGGGGSELEWISGHFGGGHGGGGSGFGPAGTVFGTGAGPGFGRARFTYDKDTDSCSGSRRVRPGG